MKKVLRMACVAGALVFSVSAMADFSAGMTKEQIETEVSNRVKNSEDLASIAVAAEKVGVSAIVLTSVLMDKGYSAEAVVSAMMVGSYETAAVAQTIVSVAAAKTGLSGTALTEKTAALTRTAVANGAPVSLASASGAGAPAAGAPAAGGTSSGSSFGGSTSGSFSGATSGGGVVKNASPS